MTAARLTPSRAVGVLAPAMRARTPVHAVASPSIRGCRHQIRSRCSSAAVNASDTSSDTSSGATPTLAERKKLLVRLCAGTDRGKRVTPDTAAAIEEQVRAIEALNRTADPAIAEGISGRWSLLYTGATQEDAAKRAELEGALGSALTEVTGSSGNVAARSAEGGASSGSKPLGRTISTFSGAVENKGNFQDIDAEAGTVENRAELEIFGTPLEVKITVGAGSPEHTSKLRDSLQAYPAVEACSLTRFCIAFKGALQCQPSNDV